MDAFELGLRPRQERRTDGRTDGRMGGAAVAQSGLQLQTMTSTNQPVPVLSCRYIRTRVEAMNSLTPPQRAPLSQAISFLSFASSAVEVRWRQEHKNRCWTWGVNADSKKNSQFCNIFSVSVFSTLFQPCQQIILKHAPCTPFHSTPSHHTSAYTFSLSFMLW